MDLNEAKKIASRCLECNNPRCVEGCPINQNIPKFIKYIKEENLEEAYKTITEKNYFGSICGRVCAHDLQCKGNCVLNNKGEGIDIGSLEAFVSDWGIKNIKAKTPNTNNKKITVIGAGVASLTLAIKLIENGFDVTIFEKTNNIGGILNYGLPEDRLPKDIVASLIDNEFINKIKIEKGKELGIDFNIDDLFKEGYKAIFLGIGCDIPRRLNVNGEDRKNVYYAKDFLKRIDNLNFENVIVVGGGNVAIDVASLAKEKGAKEVNILYRRDIKDMKANKKEIDKALEKNINIIPNSVVKEILGEEKVEGVKLLDGKEYKADTVVIAIGTMPDENILKDIKISEKNTVIVNENGETSKENVFAGGDLTESRKNVSTAIKSALIAAEGICRKLK